jgi:hypothetical protein
MKGLCIMLSCHFLAIFNYYEIYLTQDHKEFYPYAPKTDSGFSGGSPMMTI